ncbi:MAG TPA: PKD domain-containing protein [Coriobacteriia bacterium]|jgi:hypothetical protein
MRIRWRQAAIVVLATAVVLTFGGVAVASAAPTLTEYVCDFEGVPAIPGGWAVSASPQASWELVTDPDGTSLKQDILPTATSNRGSVLSFTPPADGTKYELEGWFYVDQAYAWGMTTSPFVMAFPGGKVAGVQISTNVGSQRGYYTVYTGSSSVDFWDKNVAQHAWHNVKVTYDRAANTETVMLDGATILANQPIDTAGTAPWRMDVYAAGGWRPGNAITQYLDDLVVRVWKGATNGPPVLSAARPSVSATEGSVATNGGLVSDPDGDAVALSASRGKVVNNGDGTWSWSQAVADGPSGSGPVTITADDGRGGTVQVTFLLSTLNAAPAVGPITGPEGAIGAGVSADFSAAFTDAGVLDTHSAVWDWGDGTTSAGKVTGAGGSGTVAGRHSYAKAGFYAVSLVVTDNDGGAGSASLGSLPVFDPGAGFVTGGGSFVSPAGSFAEWPRATGKATFAFHARYGRRDKTLSGNAVFQLHPGRLNFKATSFDWLVVSGKKAVAQGSGTMNGRGDCGFLVSAIDRRPDTVRVKIWDKATGAVIYDSQTGAGDAADPTTRLRGGNVVVHR